MVQSVDVIPVHGAVHHRRVPTPVFRDQHPELDAAGIIPKVAVVDRCTACMICNCATGVTGPMYESTHGHAGCYMGVTGLMYEATQGAVWGLLGQCTSPPTAYA